MSDLKTAPVARRAFVAGIAGAAAATVAPAALAMTNRDPIFAAIEAHRAATAVVCAVNEVDTGLENEPALGREDRYALGQHPRQARWSAGKRSGSNGGLGLLVHLPIPGKQVGDFVGRMIGEPGQHVSEPGLRIDVVHLAGFHQGIDGGGTMAAGV